MEMPCLHGFGGDCGGLVLSQVCGSIPGGFHTQAAKARLHDILRPLRVVFRDKGATTEGGLRSTEGTFTGSKVAELTSGTAPRA